jgi:tetratricopeptide (TPR) repeat protein
MYKWYLGLILAVGLAYSSSFCGVFLFDDGTAIDQNPTIRSFWTAFQPPDNGAAVQRRPVVNLSLALNYAISGLDTWSYHLFNLIAHAMVACLLFAILRHALAGRIADATLVSFAIALLWAVHPLLTEAVTYVVQRTEVLAGLFYLLTIYCVIRGWNVAAVLACAMAMGSKEAAISAPFVVLLYDRLFISESWKEIFEKRWGLYLGLVSTWIVTLVMLPHGHEGVHVFGGGIQPVCEYALAQCKVITHYLRLCFWPSPLVLDYGTLKPCEPAQIIPYLLFIVGLVAMIGVLWRYRPRLGFLGICFFAILAPSSSIVPLFQQVAAEKRMYLPLAVVITSVVLLGHKYLSLRVFQGVMVSLAIVLALLTFQRNLCYSSSVSIWQDAVNKKPDNDRACASLALALADDGQFDRAFEMYEKTVQLNPNYATYRLSYANALMQAGRKEEAVAQYRQALEINPNSATARNSLANILLGDGDINGAAEQYKKAIAADPRYAEAYNNLGAVCVRKKDVQAGIAHFQKAIELNPNYAEAHCNLATMLASVGQTSEAIQHYQKAIEIKPDYIKAHNLLQQLTSPPENSVRPLKENTKANAVEGGR